MTGWRVHGMFGFMRRGRRLFRIESAYCGPVLSVSLAHRRHHLNWTDTGLAVGGPTARLAAGLLAVF